MKTNQMMKRRMGDFSVTKRTKDGFFNATTLLKQWNEKSGMKKEIHDYFVLSSTKEFIATIIERENYDTGNSPYHKSRANKGENAGTWMHPMLFIDFAMWINPSFKYDVLKFVYDEMIKYRNEAGDAYNKLGSAVSKIVRKDFMPQAMQKVGEALNWIVFNEHERNIRNQYGEEKKQRELYELERKVADLINEGFIKSYDQMLTYLKNVYRHKYLPAVFS